MMQTKILIPKEEIEKKTEELSSTIAKEYSGKNLVVLGVLDGSFIFASDFVRALWRNGCQDFQTAFIGISSYGAKEESSRKPHITKDIVMNIENRHVLIVEDIVDTGYTLKALQNLLKERNPASLKTLVLLSKPERRELEVPVEYIGFEIPNKWVVGYGFDIDSYYRGMNEIHEKIE